MIKYFHELTDDEFSGLIDSKITYGEAEKLYPQPLWCSYPQAIYGEMGCWSLVYREDAITKEYCKDCDCYKDE